MKLRTWLIFAISLPILTTSCRKEFPDVFDWNRDNKHAKDHLSNQLVLDWNYIAFEAAGGADEGNPLLASRSNTIMHLAIHDALNGIAPLYEQYAYQQSNTQADPFAATVVAAHTVLKALWPDKGTMLDEKLAGSMSAIPDGAAKTKGIVLGLASASSILKLRASDGAYQDPVAPVPISVIPGVYNAVPPLDFLFAPFWKTMKPFAMESYDQFRSVPPPSLTSNIYTRDFNEIKEIGSLNSTTRTADQDAYKKFWYELADIGWNRIARKMAATNKIGLYATARMFALMNMAVSDGYTAGWDDKYHYYFWRPYTAIHAAATDGNEQTKEDLNWESSELTPPVPEYPSTHSAIGNAAASVLTKFFGHSVSFSTTSTTALPSGAVRSFKSFKEAADENANSRVLAGIHFRFSCVAGQKQGDAVGKWTLQNHLKPVK